MADADEGLITHTDERCCFCGQSRHVCITLPLRVFRPEHGPYKPK
jgi:hypothetical protein